VHDLNLETLELSQRPEFDVTKSGKKKKTTISANQQNSNQKKNDLIDTDALNYVDATNDDPHISAVKEEEADFEDPANKKVKPNYTEEDSIIFTGYLVDLNQFKEIGRYAAWLIFDMNLKTLKVTQKHEYEPKYIQLDKIVNSTQFKVTSMELHKILSGL
jgi:hypothetical protein